MPEIIEWPCDLGVRDTDFFLKWTTRSAGRLLAGHEQIVGVNAAVWEVSLTFARTFNGDRLRRFEALVARMRGRQNVAALCVCDPYRYGPRVAPQQWPHDDGTWFSDGTGYADGPTGAMQPLLASAPAAVGATSVSVGLTNPVRPNLRIGDMFSRSGFLYRTVGVAGSVVQFEPPLRRAIAVDDALTTNPPKFFGRFATDDEGRRVRENLKWGAQVTVNFVEAFDR